MKRKKEEEEEQKTVAVINRKIELKITGIMVAEESISAANAKLHELSILLEKNISRVELQKAQSTLQMGLQRKSALENEISALENVRNQAKKMKKK